jgi:hypothetical protein
MRCALVLLLLSLPVYAYAQRTVSADKPIAVSLPVGQPTSVAFPEVIDSVQAVHFGEQSARPLSVEMRGPYLYLILNEETYTGRLFVLGKSGKQYMVTFKVGTPGDVVVHVVVPKAASPKVALTPVGIPSILRALWTQRPLPGQQETDMPPPALPDSRLVVVESQAVQMVGYTALVLRVRNTSGEALALDLRTEEGGAALPGTLALSQWVWPPRFSVQAIAAEQELLTPGQDTRLFVVLARRG